LEYGQEGGGWCVPLLSLCKFQSQFEIVVALLVDVLLDSALMRFMIADDEKKLNATYIISVARKLGCTVFLLPEDIMEVAYENMFVNLSLTSIWLDKEHALTCAFSMVCVR
jgi:hypothetical protein